MPAHNTSTEVAWMKAEAEPVSKRQNQTLHGGNFPLNSAGLLLKDGQ